jgi:peptidoglycan hydrolase CwlO-like protein
MSGVISLNTSLRRSRVLAVVVACTVAALVPVATPTEGQASPGQSGPSGQEDRDRDGSPASPGLDEALLRASSSDDVDSSLDELSADVQEQVAAVVTAREAHATAEAELAAAEATVASTQEVIDDLTVQSDEVVVEAFISPPAESAMETLSADSLTDATVKMSILSSNADANADILTRLEAAQAELELVKATQAEAAAAAEQRAAEADAALADLVASQSAESLFVLAVQDRLAARLAEADALDSLDPAAADAIRAREGEVAAEAIAEAEAQAEADAAAAAASGGGGSMSLGPASGSLATVACPGGGSITVDSSLAGSLRSMLDAAAAQGLNMCGGGYRDPAQQIALRRSHCGTSNYAIYEAPSSSCSPPTARPGSSNHEQGLAIDFTCNGGGTIGTSSPCFTWLKNNAASYGLYNLPSEPWHWSNDGT